IPPALHGLCRAAPAPELPPSSSAWLYRASPSTRAASLQLCMGCAEQHQHQSCLPPALHAPSTRAASLQLCMDPAPELPPSQLASARTPARALQAPLATHTTLAGAPGTGYRSRAEIW
uniref:Uncharacterized protein n=1 Tax=Catharus ustulatus TaxID=91951 RepID=A0A8C3Y3J1_CATUS